MEAAADADPRGKRDPRDFALWKGHKPDEPDSASWPTPWGRGRPGWHLECSAMAGKYLGDEFDIHGGGLDLRFPHHENELAQSTAAGQRFARFWMHNALLTAAGEKMSKSLGNGALVSEVIKRFPPRAVRLYLAQPHYRSTIEYSDEALGESVAALARVDHFRPARHRARGQCRIGAARSLRRGDGRRSRHPGRCRRAPPVRPGRQCGLGRRRRRCRGAAAGAGDGDADRARAQRRQPTLAAGQPRRSVAETSWTAWSVSCSISEPQRVHGRTTRPPTRSVRRWPDWASRSPTLRKVSVGAG